MRRCSGQAIVDHLGAITAVLAVALVVGAAMARSGAAAAIASRLGGEARQSLAADDRALLDEALAGTVDAPTLDDAVALASIGRDEDAVRALAAALAYGRYAAAALRRGTAGAAVSPRGAGTARIVSPADETRLLRREAGTNRSRNRRQAVALAGEVVVGVVTESFAVGLATWLGARLLGGPPARSGREIPPGMAAGDVVLCMPIRWRGTGRPGPRQAIPPARPGEILKPSAQPGRTYDAALAVIVRGGRELLQVALAGDACETP